MALKKITAKDFEEAVDKLTPYGEGDVMWLKELGKTDNGTGLYLVIGWTRDLGYSQDDIDANGFGGDDGSCIAYKIGYFNYKPGVRYMLQEFDDFNMPYNLKDDKANGIYMGDVWDTDAMLSNTPSEWANIADDLNKDAQGIWDTWGANGELDQMAESKKTKGESKMNKCSMQKKIESVGKKSEIRTNLEPRFDSRKSFYGKAQVDDEGGSKTLYSYNTPVARVTDGKLELLPKWNFSQTTRRHVADFAKQMGVEDQYLKLKKGESKGCSMQKKIESLAKKNEGDNGAWAWTVTVEFDDNGKTTSKKYVVNAHNRESAVDQAKLRPLRSNPDAKNIKVVRCDMGESFSKKSEGAGDIIKVAAENVMLTVNDVYADEHGGSFSVETPEEGKSYNLLDMQEMLRGMCEDCTGYADYSRDGSELLIKVMAGEMDDNGEWTGDYYTAYSFRCTARIMSYSLEGVIDFLDDDAQ